MRPPLWLQVVWKVLLFGMTAILVYAAVAAPSAEGKAAISALAVAFFIFGVFFELGEE